MCPLPVAIHEIPAHGAFQGAFEGNLLAEDAEQRMAVRLGRLPAQFSAGIDDNGIFIDRRATCTDSCPTATPFRAVSSLRRRTRERQ